MTVSNVFWQNFKKKTLFHMCLSNTDGLKADHLGSEAYNNNIINIYFQKEEVYPVTSRIPTF